MTRTVRAGIAAALLAGSIGLAACSGTDKPVSHANKPPAAARPAPTPEVEEPAAPAYDTPRPSDFVMKVKETSREHYGYGVGDNVEYKLELIQVNGKTFDPEITYDLKYKVIGDEDGPDTDTIELHGDSYEKPWEDMASTVTDGKITAKVVSITEA